jgi:hypothetical protein
MAAVDPEQHYGELGDQKNGTAKKNETKPIAKTAARFPLCSNDLRESIEHDPVPESGQLPFTSPQ